MAKQDIRTTGGVRGPVGNLIGYNWRGKWCWRTKPAHVANPCTDRQVNCRDKFGEEVRLAGYMNNVLRDTLDVASLGEEMTAGNYFVHINQGAFDWQNEELVVDYEALQISAGPVAPVEFTEVEVSEQQVLTVRFTRGDTQRWNSSEDRVSVYLYCPELKSGIAPVAVTRRSKMLQTLLPDYMMGKVVHLYGYVTDFKRNSSETVYLGCFMVGDAFRYNFLPEDDDVTESLTPAPDATTATTLAAADTAAPEPSAVTPAATFSPPGTIKRE